MKYQISPSPPTQIDVTEKWWSGKIFLSSWFKFLKKNVLFLELNSPWETYLIQQLIQNGSNGYSAWVVSFPLYINQHGIGSLWLLYEINGSQVVILAALSQNE